MYRKTVDGMARVRKGILKGASWNKAGMVSVLLEGGAIGWTVGYPYTCPLGTTVFRYWNNYGYWYYKVEYSKVGEQYQCLFYTTVDSGEYALKYDSGLVDTTVAPFTETYYSSGDERVRLWFNGTVLTYNQAVSNGWEVQVTENAEWRRANI